MSCPDKFWISPKTEVPQPLQHLSLIQGEINSQIAKSMEQKNPTPFIDFISLLGQRGKKNPLPCNFDWAQTYYSHKYLWSECFSIFLSSFVIKERRQLKNLGESMCAWQLSRFVLLLLPKQRVGKTFINGVCRKWKRERLLAFNLVGSARSETTTSAGWKVFAVNENKPSLY